jgi:polysaccharide export outer membrane protein
MRLRSLLSLLLAILVLALAACANGPDVGPAIHAELVSPYRLDSGDQLRIIVYGQADLTNSYVVDQAGTITVPLIGSLEARGQTTADMQAAIAARLRQGFVRDPNVSVEVDHYRPFFAMGEVATAGQYSYVPGMTVQQAIAVAGGFSPRADKSSVQVTRSIDGRVETATLGLSDPVAPGDTLYVRERFF